MSYRIKEAFYSLQGEGFHTGRPAIFCRFSHCNLWTGKEADRATAVCQFCDTDFIGEDGQNGGRFEDAKALLNHLLALWPKNTNTHPFFVLTGGEPLLQVDQQLIDIFHKNKVEIAVETNGTLKAPQGLDWVCVSPKANAPIIQDSGNELKLVFPQKERQPEDVEHLEFEHFYLQPMADSNPAITQHNIQVAVEYCLKHPKWKLSLQTHKILNID
ncbi:7-carboxy-7-deazaguanine synthase [Hydrogenovibrio kuenenii]|uniref:7-carboxy-7-deazaguanine synthase n=1 Tax=Hydrogenovibrio kuenenii TaxID=63658 RepID=UPI0004632EB2|nr:7-carboxy-7-deazaguanine synthase [Hydrogenovibrio kuenenii]